MNKYLGIVALFVLLILSNASACNIIVNSLTTEVRSDGDYYYSNISASKNQDIDVRLSFDVDAYSGSNCPTDIAASLKIYRYNSNTNNWELLKTSAQKTQELSNSTYIFVWSNEFNTGNYTYYTRYRVDGNVLNGSTTLATEQAYIDVTDNSCTGIKLVTSPITVDEGRSTTKNFTIQNTTNKEFEISNANILFSNSVILSGDVDYDTFIYSGTTRNIALTIDTGYVSSTMTTSGTLAVSGYLGNTYCSEYDIGRKAFNVTVQNVSSNDSDYDHSSSSAECDELEIQTREITMDEGTEQKAIFSIKNNSSKKFEILQVSSTSNGAEISEYYNEKYVFPSNVSDLVLSIRAPEVNSDANYSNTLKVSGRFEDGRSCQFNDIPAKNYNVKVLNTSNSTAIDCSAYSLVAQNTIEVNNGGSLPFTLTNGTNTSATVIVEGTVNATPSVIVVPSKSSLSRQISFSINDARGEITLVSQVAGCSFAPKTIQVINNAKGSISQVSISADTIREGNSLKVTLQINNPTGKTFNGIISLTMPFGWEGLNKELTVNPGTNIVELTVTKSVNASEGKATAAFQSEGSQIVTEFYTTGNNALTGLFSFGTVNSFGFLLLIVLVVLVIIGIIGSLGPVPSEKESGQNWIKKE
jgi:hypothetical protein